MHQLRAIAAASLAVATLVLLGGCASEPASTQTADTSTKDPCLGVAPPTGSLLRRKEDCGAHPQDDLSKQEAIDAIRAKSVYGPASVHP